MNRTSLSIPKDFKSDSASISVLTRDVNTVSASAFRDNTTKTRRTGVQVPPLGSVRIIPGSSYEDLDDFYKSSQRPERFNREQEKISIDDDQSQSSDEIIGTAKQISPSTRRKEKKQQLKEIKEQEHQKNRMKYQDYIISLPRPKFHISTSGNDKKNISEDMSTSSSPTIVETSSYINRFLRPQNPKVDANPTVLLSPSDLSRVSTIAPTPISIATPATSSATKSILKSKLGRKSAEDDKNVVVENIPTPISDKSVRWSIADKGDENSELNETAVDNLYGRNEETEVDLYPIEEEEEELNYHVSSRLVGQVDEMALNTTLDRAAQLLPCPSPVMTTNKDQSTPYSLESPPPPPLEDSMLEMLNNTDGSVSGNLNNDSAEHMSRNGHVRDSSAGDNVPVDPFADSDDDKDDDAFFASHDLSDEDEPHKKETDFREVASTSSSAIEENTKEKKAKSKNNEVEPTISPISPETPAKKAVGKKKKSKQMSSKLGKVQYATPPGFKGRPIANRAYERIPISQYKDENDDDSEMEGAGGNVRRSKRARFKPLEFWRNEKLIYEPHNETGALGEAMGLMPVVTGVMHALPTPHIRRKRDKVEDSDSDSRDRKPRKIVNKRRPSSSDADVFDASKLHKKYQINESDTGLIWSESDLDICDARIVSYFNSSRFVDLPVMRPRAKNESKVSGKALQSFNFQSMMGRIPGWLAGLVLLPPSAIKDAEGVGSCLQQFYVLDCQPKSLEFALGNPEDGDGIFHPESAQRYLLSKGDSFYVPPGNLYRLENHSNAYECLLSYNIVRPFPIDGATNNNSHIGGKKKRN